MTRMTNQEAADVLEDIDPITVRRHEAIQLAISVLRGGHGERRRGNVRRINHWAHEWRESGVGPDKRRTGLSMYKGRRLATDDKEDQ